MLGDLLHFNGFHELSLELKISQRNIIDEDVLLEATLLEHFLDLLGNLFSEGDKLLGRVLGTRCLEDFLGD